MADKEVSKAEALARKIATVIRRSATQCSEREIVDALIAVAAGRAVVGQTHDDCKAFEDHAHTAFHSAMAAVTMRRQKGPQLVH